MKKITKKLINIILIYILILSFFGISFASYKQGFDKGYWKGYFEGHKIGRDEGLNFEPREIQKWAYWNNSDEVPVNYTK